MKRLLFFVASGGSDNDAMRRGCRPISCPRGFERVKQSSKLVAVCLIAALSAACNGGNGIPPSTPSAPQHVEPSFARHALKVGSEQLLYSFKGGTDGEGPHAALINLNGTLDGTTAAGGDKGECFQAGCGTVFTIGPSGVETTRHRFGNEYAEPLSPLLDVKGTLYGTTAGIRRSKGTAFAITASGKFRLLHHFGKTAGDGARPLASLTDVNGTLFGTTVVGGANGVGTVFSITTSGAENVLYSFGGGSGDGAYPQDGLLNVSGTLYGTTSGGGEGCSASGGCGTVFSITTSGKEAVLHRFTGGSQDGANPYAGLVDVHGTLYGTTYSGGSSSSCATFGQTGCGTVFSITTSGKETLLYRFKGGSDGAGPVANLIDVRGTFYSTTSSGGGRTRDCKDIGVRGCGTVFSVTASGKERVLYSFRGFAHGDGQFPAAGLLNVNGTLYGTTSGGGAIGWGTVFSLTP